jgi:hypothetical protein
MGLLDDFEKEVSEESVLEGADKKKLNAVAELGQRQIELQDEIQNINDELKQRTKELFLLTSNTIPELMKEIGLKSFTLDTGENLEVAHIVKASIAVKNRPEAFKWLRENNFGDIIKNQVVINFDRGQDDEAAEVIAEANDKGLSPEQKESVHAMTLTAFVKEQMEKGSKIPMELLGVFEYDLTKIAAPKKRKRK